MGIAPSALLRADRVELLMLAEIMHYAARAAAERDEALANRIIHELAQAMKRGRR